MLFNSSLKFWETFPSQIHPPHTPHPHPIAHPYNITCYTIPPWILKPLRQYRTPSLQMSIHFNNKLAWIDCIRFKFVTMFTEGNKHRPFKSTSNINQKSSFMFESPEFISDSTIKIQIQGVPKRHPMKKHNLKKHFSQKVFIPQTFPHSD